jgi:hypothetical protein
VAAKPITLSDICREMQGDHATIHYRRQRWHAKWLIMGKISLCRI